MLKSHSKSMLWPAVIDPRDAQVFAYLTQIERSQWHRPDQLRRLQSLQLTARLRHAARHSAFFAPRLAGREIDRGNALEVLASLPPLTRADMQSHADEIHCQAPEDHGVVRTLRTSGSSGQPVEVRCTAACFALRAAFTIRSIGWRAMDMRKTVAAIRASVKTGTADEPVQYQGWGSHMSALFHTGKALGLPIQVPVTEQLEFLERYKPAYLITYPSNLRALLDQSPEKPSSLECLISIGETLHPEIADDVRSKWGIPIYDDYSSEELGTIASQCPHGNLHCSAESLIVEVIDEEGSPCAPGQVGRVVVTDMANFASAMLRYEIRDYAEVGEPCGCKRGLPTLKRIVGRERNMMVLPGGQRFWPQFGMRDPEVTRLVRQYQFVQTALDRLEMKVAADQTLTNEQRGWLVGVVRKRLGHPFRIDIEQVEGEIPKGPNGKFHEFVCLVPT
ncbi:MAG: phenylacetate--CoA ligase family protein [Sphingomonadales bacterium]